MRFPRQVSRRRPVIGCAGRTTAGCFAAGPLEAAWTNQALGFTVPPERERMAGYGSFAAVTSVLEGAVARGPYLAGDSFTAADLYVGSQLGFGLQFGMIEKRPAFVDYVARLSARPAAVRAKEIDDALTPPPQT
jgi:glutathione S-transferase